MLSERIAHRAPMAWPKHFAISLICFLTLSFYVSVAPAATASKSHTTLADAQKQIRTMAHELSGALSLEQISKLKELLQSSKVLDADRLEPATIEALGVLLSNAGEDKDFQDTYLDDWPGLWARVGIDVDPYGFAYLMDRISLSEGHRQIYGSIRENSTEAPLHDEDPLSFAHHRDRLGIEANDFANLGVKSSRSSSPSLAMRRPNYPLMPKLRAELLRLVQIDQAARAVPDRPMSEVEEQAWAKKMMAVDATILPHIQAIYSKYGFPSVADVGRSGVQAAFLLIQHAINAPKLMSQAARDAKKLMSHGDLPMMDYALLVDRVACLIDHKPQIYGTQGNRIPKDYSYCTIEKPDRVNARRAALLLPPLSREEIYGPVNSFHR